MEWQDFGESETDGSFCWKADKSASSFDFSSLGLERLENEVEDEFPEWASISCADSESSHPDASCLLLFDRYQRRYEAEQRRRLAVLDCDNANCTMYQRESRSASRFNQALLADSQTVIKPNCCAFFVELDDLEKGSGGVGAGAPPFTRKWYLAHTRRNTVDDPYCDSAVIAFTELKQEEQGEKRQRSRAEGEGKRGRATERKAAKEPLIIGSEKNFHYYIPQQFLAREYRDKLRRQNSALEDKFKRNQNKNKTQLFHSKTKKR